MLLMMEAPVPAKPARGLRADAPPFTLEAAAAAAGLLPSNSQALFHASSTAGTSGHRGQGAPGRSSGTKNSAISESTAAAHAGASSSHQSKRQLLAQPSIVERMMMKETSVDPRDAATLLPDGLLTPHSLESCIKPQQQQQGRSLPTAPAQPTTISATAAARQPPVRSLVEAHRTALQQRQAAASPAAAPATVEGHDIAAASHTLKSNASSSDTVSHTGNKSSELAAAAMDAAAHKESSNKAEQQQQQHQQRVAASSSSKPHGSHAASGIKVPGHHQWGSPNANMTAVWGPMGAVYPPTGPAPPVFWSPAAVPASAAGHHLSMSPVQHMNVVLPLVPYGSMPTHVQYSAVPGQQPGQYNLRYSHGTSQSDKAPHSTHAAQLEHRSAKGDSAAGAAQQKQQPRKGSSSSKEPIRGRSTVTATDIDAATDHSTQRDQSSKNEHAAATMSSARSRRRSSNREITQSAAAAAAAAASTTGPPDASSVMKWCHVLHARHQAPELAPTVVKQLVAEQIKTAKPVRAPWYRDSMQSSSSGGGGVQHSSGSGSSSKALSRTGSEDVTSPADAAAAGSSQVTAEKLTEYAKAAAATDEKEATADTVLEPAEPGSGADGKPTGMEQQQQQQGSEMPHGTGVFIPGYLRQQQ